MTAVSSIWVTLFDYVNDIIKVAFKIASYMLARCGVFWRTYMTPGAAWPTGTPGDFPVGHQKFVACGPSRQAIFSPISLVKINKLFVISAPASLILMEQ